MTVTISETCRCGMAATASAEDAVVVRDLMVPFNIHRERCINPVFVADREPRPWHLPKGQVLVLVAVHPGTNHGRVVGVFLQEEGARGIAESEWEPGWKVVVTRHGIGDRDGELVGSFGDDGWTLPAGPARPAYEMGP